MPGYDLKKSPRDRIRYLMDSHGFTNPYALERATGLKRSTIKNIMSKDTIGPRAARKIAEVFDLNVAWVESGFGPIFNFITFS